MEVEKLKDISIKVKGLVLKNPGLTRNEINMKLSEENRISISTVIRIMRRNGMIIIRNDKYYSLGNSIKVKAKRNRFENRKKYYLSLREKRND